MAGISLSRSKAADRVRRELTPLGQLLIPVFFLQIGVDADVSQFVKPAVLGLAGALLLVAIVGKLASAVGLVGSPGDRLLVGLAMIPRGEVGLIFATIGLPTAIFGENLYASVLLVVLATTLMTPPLLRWRLQRLGGPAPAAVGEGGTVPKAEPPPGGWFTFELHSTGSRFDLAAEPDERHTLEIALSAAIVADDHTPGATLFAWLSDQPRSPLVWSAAARERFLDLLRSGGPRAWRFVTMTAVLDRALPELADAVSQLQAEAYEFDPIAHLEWPTLEAARAVVSAPTASSQVRDVVLVAALALDATEGDAGRAAGIVVETLERVGLDGGGSIDGPALVRDLQPFVHTARSIEAFDDPRQLELGRRVTSADQVHGLSMLARAENPGDPLLDQRISELVHQLVSTLE